jgi:adenosine deaminase
METKTQIEEASKLLKYCFSLPKIELHAHLNGSIRKATLFELLNDEDREEISKLYQNQMSFENAFKVFRIASKIVTGLDTIRRFTKEMIEDWAKVNCMYLEIRTTLKSIKPSSKEDYLRAVLEEIYAGNQKYDMQTRLIISLNRELPLEDFLETLEIYKNFADENLKGLIVGIDYCGYETNEKHMYEDVVPIFEKFRELGLKITIHMGETPKYQMFDFIKFRPDRVSHTYYFNENECEELMRHKIPIEICPTGSLSVKNLYSYKDIPFKNYHKKTVKTYSNEDYEYDLFCINTDDTMLFTTDLSQEYFEVASNFGLTCEDLKQTVLRTIEFIFDTNEELRTRLRNKLKNF